ncbi:MAG TPA: hypothetical protein PKA91_19960 [Leptospiraceae bacterium]|nr:hypothetical protein [Leptospiraceae bacterium]
MPESPPLEQPSIKDSPSVEAIVAQQSQQVQHIIKGDAVLERNIGRITNLEEFLNKLEQNKHLFDDT